MHPLRRLILEAHRRSVWKVLGVYAVTGWVTLQVVGELTRTAGLPSWLPGLALALIMIGLPVVLATAIVQEGGPQAAARASESPPATPPDAHGQAGPPVPAGMKQQLTWSRAMMGGVAAFLLLGGTVVAYQVSRTTGIGPAASLLARGDIAAGDRIVLADFRSNGPDSLLGKVVTDALRIDLLSSMLRVLEPSEIRDALTRMQLPAGTALDAERAREIALRDGLKAVLEGEVAQAGTGFILTATLRSAQGGHSLAAFRETAASDGDIIAAIDRLSRRIRERAGEPLRDIRAVPALERVTTQSLEALRIFSEANRAFDNGDYTRSIVLLEDALRIDPEFAMAWRRLSVVLGNMEIDRTREREAVTRAWELRDRLSEREIYLTEARYHLIVRGDRAAQKEAYLRVLALDPNDRHALNNLASLYAASEDYAAAAELLQRAVDGPGVSANAYSNFFDAQVGQGRYGEALRVAEQMIERYPGHPAALRHIFWANVLLDDQAAARAQAEHLLRLTSPRERASAHDMLARLALRHGRLGEARRHMAEAERLAAQISPSARVTRRLFSAHVEAAVGARDRGIQMVNDIATAGLLDDLATPDQWHFFRALVLAMAGDPHGAATVLRSFETDVPPEHHEQFRERNTSAEALIAIADGRPEEGIRLLEQLRTERGCRACYAERMGWALAEAGRLDEALAELELALKWTDLTHAYEWHAGQNLWVSLRIGPLYEEAGRPERALDHYRALVDRWQDADAELQPMVRHAAERVRLLSAGRR
jgi:eukaryotic-like serine/threonine-protein kinase